MEQMTDQHAGYGRSGPSARWRTEEIIDALVSLGGVAFLAWLALAWTGRSFDPGPEALLFSGFFLALAAGCLYRCLGCLRRLSGRR
jgi:hypothetical protein